MHGGVLVGHVTHQHDHQTDGQFHHRTRVGIGGVEYGHAPVGGGVQIDLVGADTEGGNRHQPVRRLQHPGTDLGLGAHAQDMDPLQPGDQRVLVQRPLQTLDRIARLFQTFDRRRMDVFQQQHADAVARIGPATGDALGVQDLVQRRGLAVGGGHDRRAPHHFGEGVEAIGDPAQPRLGIGPAVADHHHRSAQVQTVQGLDLAAGSGQRVGQIDAGDPSRGVIDQIIGQHPVCRHPQGLGHRGDDLAEAAGDDDDPARMAAEKSGIPPDRRSQRLCGARRQGGDMLPGQRQQGQSLPQRLTEGDVPGHGPIGQGGDLRADPLAIGGTGQRQVGQHIEGFERDERRIEIKHEGRAVGHQTSLTHLRTCSNACAVSSRTCCGSARSRVGLPGPRPRPRPQSL